MVVKDADGKMVGPSFKDMKREFVTWREVIHAKKYDLYDDKKYDQPEGAFTERNMNRSQENRVKTFMEDVRWHLNRTGWKRSWKMYDTDRLRSDQVYEETYWP